MGIFTKLAQDVFAGFTAAGVARKISPLDAATWGTEIERIIGAATSTGGLIIQNASSLPSNLNYPSLTLAWVTDSNPALAGIYQKQGASGTGSWVRLLDLPYSFIRLTDVGAGTANAIVATSTVPLPSAPSAALLVMNVFEANTGDVTLSVNGAAAKPLLSNSGNQLGSGGILAGMMLAFLDTGTEFRLLSEQASGSFIPAMEALLLEAEAAAEAAEEALADLLAAGFSGGYVTPESHGAVADAVRVEPCVTTSGSPNVNCVNANWTAGDVGKVFFLKRGGAIGTDTRAMHLVSTIATVVDGQNITLADNVQQTLSTVAAAYGTDDTQAWQDSLAAANLAGNPIKTPPGTKYIVTEPIGDLTTGVYGGDRDSWIYAAYDDNDLTDGSESIFRVSSDGVTVEGVCFEWFGYFKKSYISAINHSAGNDARYTNVRAEGFSGPGIQYGTNSTGVIGDAAITCRGLISGCGLSKNRIAGMLIGYSTDTKVVGNSFNENGLLGDGGTGYGCAALSGTSPFNVLILGNHGHDNHRRAFDFHAGKGIKIIGNFALRNKITAIYAEDTTITGDVIIVGNTVGEMTWNGTIASGVPGEGSAGQMFGIHLGAQNGQGLSEDPTNVIIEGNIIYDFTSTTGTAPIAIFAHSGGWSYGSLQIKNNTVRAGLVSNLLRTSPNTAGSVGNYFDVDIQGNTLIADECTSFPVYIQGATNRKKVFKGNTLIVGAVMATTGAMTYDVTAISGKSYLVEGNTVNVPATAWSGGSDWCMVKRVADEIMRNNIVNNAAWREFDGAIFTDRMAAVPSSGIVWTIGSRVANSATPGPNVPAEWRRLTSVAGDVLGTDWRAVYPPLSGYQTIATDSVFTLTPATSPYETLHTGTLTADRAVTLAATGAVAGVTKFRITRTGGGAFNLNVGAGPLKALATNTWAEFVYDGSAYRLAAAGAL